MKPTIFVPTDVDAFYLELPYPPSVNNYWQANGKRRFISKEGKLFTEQVQFIVRNAINSNNVRSLKDKRVVVNVVIHPRSKRKFDLDNTLKAILDALMKAGMYNDDSQIDFIGILRGEQVNGGKAVVYLYEGD